MEILRENSLLLEGINDQLQRSLREWKLYPQNTHVARAFNAHSEQVIGHNGILVLEVKKDNVMAKMQENDTQMYGYEKDENWVCEIRKSRFLSLKIMDHTYTLSLGVAFDGSGPASIGQFSPEDIVSLSVK